MKKKKKDFWLMHPAIGVFLFLFVVLNLCKSTLEPVEIECTACKENLTIASPGSNYIVTLVNQKRSEFGLPPLKISHILTESATNRACFLLKNPNKWTHTGWVPFIEKSVKKHKWFKWFTAGENLVRDYIHTPDEKNALKNDQDRLNALMRSETHKAVILNARFSEIGIGRCGKYLVQHFAGI